MVRYKLHKIKFIWSKQHDQRHLKIKIILGHWVKRLLQTYCLALVFWSWLIFKSHLLLIIEGSNIYSLSERLVCFRVVFKNCLQLFNCFYIDLSSITLATYMYKTRITEEKAGVIFQSFSFRNLEIFLWIALLFLFLLCYKKRPFNNLLHTIHAGY